MFMNKHRMKITLTKAFQKINMRPSIFLIGIKYTERTFTVTNKKLSELCQKDLGAKRA